MFRANLDHLVNCLFEAGVTRWAVSPGSRNAPVIAGLVRHGGFDLYSFPDERSAAFAALGMSQAMQYPCGVICTSGTAVLNLYPAICEAYYQRVPLLVLTADRPPELIDQWDGQTIRQEGIFDKHIVAGFQCPDDLHETDRREDLNALVYQAVSSCFEEGKGPVHINVPLRDPIYADVDAEFNVNLIKPLVMPKTPAPAIDRTFLRAELNKYPRILLLAGQMEPDQHLAAGFRTASMLYPLLADITAHLGYESVPGWELAAMANEIPEELQPDLLVTFGLSVLSKPLKAFLRKNKPEAHWHISTGGFTGDPFGTKPETHRVDPAEFLDALTDFPAADATYRQGWIDFCAREPHLHLDHLQATEFEAVKHLLKWLPENTVIQAGNSMAIRYLAWAADPAHPVFCNRGTSGIDGCVSTAVGFALAASDQNVVCILGDMAFLYDSNALWTDSLPSNLAIVVLNNGGGGIFDFIEGPSRLPEMRNLVVTPHQRTAAHIARDFGVDYYQSSFNAPDMAEHLKKPWPLILELQH